MLSALAEIDTINNQLGKALPSALLWLIYSLPSRDCQLVKIILARQVVKLAQRDNFSHYSTMLEEGIVDAENNWLMCSDENLNDNHICFEEERLLLSNSVCIPSSSDDTVFKFLTAVSCIKTAMQRESPIGVATIVANLSVLREWEMRPVPNEVVLQELKNLIINGIIELKKRARELPKGA